MDLRKKIFLFIGALIISLIYSPIGDRGYWLFSTIAQSFSALVALAVMLVIFRMETLTNRINNAREKIISAIKERNFAELSPNISDKDLMENSKKFQELKFGKDNAYKDREFQYKISESYWYKASIEGMNLKKRTEKFILIALFVIIISLLSLIFVENGKETYSCITVIIFKFLFACLITGVILSFIYLFHISKYVIKVKEAKFWESIEKETTEEK